MRTSIKLFLVASTFALLFDLTSDAPQAATGSGAGRAPSAIAADIDRYIDQKLTEAKIPVSPTCDDAEFIRRASLDIRGRIPLAERVTKFLADTSPNKRANLVDEFLADSEFGDHLAIIWYHRMVKPDDDNRQLISATFHDWLAERFNANPGWDKIVTEILTASGSRDKNPQTVFFLANVSGDNNRQPEANKLTAAASHLFLGVKLECAECHNHPFTTWKQTDFWGMAAFFGDTHSDKTTKKDAKAGEIPVVHDGGKAKVNKKAVTKEAAPVGSIVIPDTKGKTVKAKFPLAEEPGSTVALRQTFAAWATSQKNPFFAKAMTNWMWGNFFGKGLINPVDDIRADSKCSHPELLKKLSDDFAASGFDIKHLIRAICLSNAYQRTSKPLPGNKDDSELYSHMMVKIMTADQLYDSLGVALGHAAAGAGEKGKAKGANKKQVGGPRAQFRNFFHTEADDDVAAVEDYSHGIPQVLRLMNSAQMNDLNPIVNRLTKAGAPEQIIEAMYLASLSRKPTDIETQRMVKYATSEKAKGYNDVYWVLLNSSEFVLNH